MVVAATVLILLSPLHILLDSVKCTFTVIMLCINQRAANTGRTGLDREGHAEVEVIKPRRREAQSDWSSRQKKGRLNLATRKCVQSIFEAKKGGQCLSVHLLVIEVLSLNAN